MQMPWFVCTHQAAWLIVGIECKLLSMWSQFRTYGEHREQNPHRGYHQ